MRFERLGGNRRGVYFAHDDGTLVNAIPGSRGCIADRKVSIVNASG